MPRNDGVRYGAGGQVLQEIVEAPKVYGKPLAQKQNKKVSVTNFVNNLPSFIGFSNSYEDISDATQTAVSITKAVTLLQTSGAVATTLANGTVIGQLKIIVNDTDGGASELTPASTLGYTNIDFTDDGDSVTLMWTGTAWAIVAAVKVATNWGIVEISDD